MSQKSRILKEPLWKNNEFNSTKRNKKLTKLIILRS